MWISLQTELMKVKRYRLLWSGVALMLLSVLLTLFTSTANDGSVWDFRYLVEQVVKNNQTMTFPACISLIVGYSIAREDSDGTLKNLRAVPVSLRQLVGGKLLLGGLLALLFGAASFAFTLLAEAAARFPGFTVRLAAEAAVQLPLHCLLLYVAVLPIVTGAFRIGAGALGGTAAAFAYGYSTLLAAGSPTLFSWYPPGAALGLARYRAYDPAARYDLTACACSLALAAAVSALLVSTLQEKEPRNARTVSERKPTKKGW